MVRSAGERRVGYVLNIVFSMALLFVANVWPGWRSVPFLTEDAAQLVGLFNLSLWAGIVANLVNVLLDRRWVKALGDLVTVAISLVFLARTWQVFPFDFGDSSFEWDLVARVVLGVSIAGCAIAIIVQVVLLVGSLFRATTPKTR